MNRNISRSARFLLPTVALWLAVPAFAGDQDQLKCGVNQDRVWIYDSLTSMDISARLKCGESVEIVSRVKGYVKIHSASGVDGYVPDSALPDLPPLPDPENTLVAAASSAAPSTTGGSSLAAAAKAAIAAANRPSWEVSKASSAADPAPIVAPAPSSVPLQPVMVASAQPPVTTPAPVAAPAPVVPAAAVSAPPKTVAARPTPAPIAVVPVAPARVAATAPVSAKVVAVSAAPADPISARMTAPAPAPAAVAPVAPAPVAAPTAVALVSTPKPAAVPTVASNAPSAVVPVKQKHSKAAPAAALAPTPVPARTPSAPVNEAKLDAPMPARTYPVRDIVTSSSPTATVKTASEKTIDVPIGAEYPDTEPANESADPACHSFFSAYGLSPSQFKWLEANRQKLYPSICPAPDLGRVDFVVLFTHDSDTYNAAMPTPVHTDRGGFSDFNPLTTVDTALLSGSDADHARREYVWVFRMRRGGFDPIRFSPRRRPQFSTESKGSAKAIQDAFNYLQEQGTQLEANQDPGGQPVQ